VVDDRGLAAVPVVAGADGEPPDEPDPGSVGGV
jgi:hypothetical protein